MTNSYLPLYGSYYSADQISRYRYFLLPANKHIPALEIRNEERNNLELYSDEVIINDYLNMDTNNKYNIIIGNPPYSKAIDFVNKSLQLLNRDGGSDILIKNCVFGKQIKI